MIKKIKNYLHEKHPELFGLLYNFKLSIVSLLKTGLAVPREYIILGNKKLIYLVNPKVGCSSIKKTFIKKDIDDNYSIHKVKFNKKANLYNKEYDEFYKFTFVRNPFDRLVSCYESKYRSDRARVRPENLYFNKYLFGFLKKDKGFSNFVIRVCVIPFRLADWHFQSQHLLVYGDKKNSKIDYIGKFENFESDFSLIKEEYGLEELPHFNSSDKKNWMEYYTLRSAKLVHRKFKKDFDAFGYKNEYKKLINYLKTNN